MVAAGEENMGGTVEGLNCVMGEICGMAAMARDATGGGEGGEGGDGGAEDGRGGGVAAAMEEVEVEEEEEEGEGEGEGEGERCVPPDVCTGAVGAPADDLADP